MNDADVRTNNDRQTSKPFEPQRSCHGKGAAVDCVRGFSERKTTQHFSSRKRSWKMLFVKLLSKSFVYS